MHFRWVLLKQALLQRIAKTLLIVLAVTMGASVVSALLNLQADLRHRMNRELREYGPNVIIVPSANRTEKYLNVSLLDSFRKDPVHERVVASTPELFVPVRIENQDAILVGAELDALSRLFPSWDWQAQTGNRTGVILGRRLGQKLGVTNGRTVWIQGSKEQQSFPVIGFVEGGEAEDDQVFVDLAWAQRLSGQETRLHAIVASVLGEISDVERDFSEFARRHPEIEFQLVRKIAAAEKIVLDKITGMMALIVSLIFIILFLCINTTVSAILLARQSEIALFRVLGARRKQILWSLTSELLALGLIGGLLGYVLGVVMAQILGRILFQTFIEPRMTIFLVTIGSSLLMMMLSSILPMMRAVNRQAALVLKEA